MYTFHKLFKNHTWRRFDHQKINMNEATFRWMMNEDPMATEKLAEGIRNFTKDIRKLEETLAGRGSSAAV